MDSGADARIVALKRMTMRLATVRRFHGLWVGAAGPNMFEQLERAHVALFFIKTLDPRRFSRLLASCSPTPVGSVMRAAMQTAVRLIAQTHCRVKGAPEISSASRRMAGDLSALGVSSPDRIPQQPVPLHVAVQHPLESFQPTSGTSP